MGKRLSKIYTRTGDDGSTGIGDGSRVGKDDLRIAAIGAVDELNATLGMVLAAPAIADAAFAPQRELLSWVQHRVFDLGGELSIPDYAIINARQTEQLEQALDVMNEELAPLENFILPAGSELIARIHLARSVCRRAERDIVALSRVAPVNVAGRHFVNRLSDYLFVLARHAARLDAVDEVLWAADGERD